MDRPIKVDNAGYRAIETIPFSDRIEMDKIPEKRFFRPDEVCQILGYKSVRSVYRLIKLGKLKPQRRGRTLWIGHDELEHVITSVAI